MIPLLDEPLGQAVWDVLGGWGGGEEVGWFLVLCSSLEVFKSL